MQVSIIVPVYNSADYLPLCIESLQAQSLLDYEILLVDDGSTDVTGSICDSYIGKDSRIKVFHQPNNGLSEARNFGLREATGEYVLFVDSDDWIAYNTCNLLYQRAKETDADIVLTTMSYWNNDNTSYKIGEKSVLFSQDVILNGGYCLHEMLKTGCYTPMVCGNLYRKQFLDSFHLFFEGRIHEDERFSPMAYYYAERVVYLSGDFYFYRQHEDSIMHNFKFKDRMLALVDISEGLYAFTVSQDDKEKMCKRDLCSLLWLAGSLYLRALKLNGSLLREGEEERLADWNTSNFQQFKGSPTKENWEWLEDLEILLLEQQKKNYYISQCSNDKRQLFIFSCESIGNKYGVGTYLRQLMQCFDLKEWMVCIVSLYASVKEHSLEEKDGIFYFSIPYNSSNVVSKGKDSTESRYYKSVFYFLTSHVRYRKVFCHFNFVHVYELAMLFKQKLNSINVFTLHYMGWSFDLLGDRETLEYALVNANDDNEKYLKMEFEKEQRFMTECCDKVITIAQHSYDTVRTLYKIPESKLVLIPNALQDEYFERTPEEVKQLRQKYGFGNNERLLIFAGRLNPVKGVIELIKAFKFLQEEMPDVRLIISGDGDFKHCFEAASPYWSQIVFTGFILKEQLFELYAIADIGIAPSLHEEFGYVVLEMMMNKLPVIVSSSTGLKEIMDEGKYGVLVDMSNDDRITRLKDIIIDWFKCTGNNKKYKELGRLRFEREYSLDIFKERMKKLYNNI